ncbi:hypothetical protein ACFVJS_00635 [Nocardioides sp. NPDC057772]|uniref:hypothetical protein n=1 Tax=Nocardioides sp. NPDC057772 TaxID=3346245 RepID=UPI00366AA4F8
MTLDQLEQEPAVSNPADASNREIDRRNAPLRTEIQLVRGGVGDASSFDRSLRESVLYVLRWSETELLTGDQDGVRWLYAFTSIRDLARYATMRGADETAAVDFMTVRADRLLDAALPELAAASGLPTGLALDIGSSAPMLVPSLPVAEAGAADDAAAGDVDGAA